MRGRSREFDDIERVDVCGLGDRWVREDVERRLGLFDRDGLEGPGESGRSDDRVEVDSLVG